MVVAAMKNFQGQTESNFHEAARQNLPSTHADSKKDSFFTLSTPWKLMKSWDLRISVSKWVVLDTERQYLLYDARRKVA